jgi:cytochrome c-type biogenesis protein CcmH/NrfG
MQLLYTLLGMLALGGLGTFLLQLRAKQKAKASLEQELRLQTIRPFQEEIAKLKTEVTRDTQEFKEARIKLREKIDRFNANRSKPDSQS